MPRPFLHLAIALGSCAALLVPLSASGCGASPEQTTCGPNGCSVCDAYGCRPAEPAVGATGGSGGGSADTAVCDPATTTCPCASNDACQGDTQCIDGLCLVPCEYTSQCGGGRICVNGKCEVGCDAQSCPDGFVCNAKSVCEVDANDPPCSVTKPCLGGLVCSSGACVGACESNADCAATEICDASTSTCIADPQPKAPCETDSSVCTSAQTCVNGYCRYACSTASDCVLIDARIPICSGGICKSEAEANPQCLSKDDCATGQDCVSNVCI